MCDPGYKFNSQSRQFGAGHFTQVVWRDSTLLGIGRAIARNRNGMDCVYTVARYRKSGNNMSLKFKTQVRKGKFGFMFSFKSKKKVTNSYKCKRTAKLSEEEIINDIIMMYYSNNILLILSSSTLLCVFF